MKRLVTLFLNGLLVVAPIGITIYILIYIFRLVDSLGKKLLVSMNLPTITGLGIVVTIGLLIFIGFVSQLWLSRKLLMWTERLITRFPGLKTVYSMVKDTIHSLIGEKRAFSQVVLVTHEDGGKRIGFLTTEDVTAFQLDKDYIAVYMPHALQVSGELRLYARENVTFIDTPVEEAMRFCLTAGVASNKEEEQASG
ncbi:hypothetical protein AM501_10450 [Aneurinibacillus migulanus]|uniref:Uncharacterized membrane protein n=1 Tax=Aneurinibacillus migulanus TaxID=47500 RepID=A0A0D1XW36_ANEMI|nr:DUF502 domain-containing protein [Aneurinibacillus migulanus]KIV51297.1 hypothetical protein TS65_28420 [Aneurinibacillus migulanus]KIV51664.1 hypothetical protein TS64_23225 [Aneurinibacillus migulanus]KON94768.1 hypothetical protein AF333_03995 [Aneurinibacillus migulanus]KPD08368.1 hypothetical protein AM501_10450 [Aneurinibacillus migulanus]MCP1354699.1 DUF502 domain-containing protein [Aneurinibacillus migulanus]